MNIIFLIGMPGVGKSYYGQQLAQKLEYQFIDSDHWIENFKNKSITQIFENEGEMVFRSYESEFLDYCKDLKTSTIISTGGGMPCFNNHISIMNDIGISVYLKISIKLLASKIKNDIKNRPILNESNGNIEEQLQKIYTKRKVFYNKASIKIPLNQAFTVDLLTKTLELSTFK